MSVSAYFQVLLSAGRRIAKAAVAPPSGGFLAGAWWFQQKQNSGEILTLGL